MRVPVHAFASDADRMVAQQRRLADASHVVMSEDVFRLAQALLKPSGPTRCRWPSCARPTSIRSRIGRSGTPNTC